MTASKSGKRVGSGIVPERLYTTEGLRREAGICRVSLQLARRAGVRPHKLGPRSYYLGRDIIEWIVTRNTEQDG